ncbi:MAG: hypothetical protein QOF60_3219 [Actinomycetota bacterium]|jgi:hypothetical protein|nr:hypothetical protein [Actinomycetota bacterium]
MTDPIDPSIAKLLAFMMLDGMSAQATNEDRCFRLSICGFSNAGIAEIVGIPVGSVNTNLYEARKKLGSPAKKAKAAKKTIKKKPAKNSS